MSATEATSDTNWPQPIGPAKRRRLQQCFEYGRANLASGNLDYAAEMFTNALAGDPGNLVYAQSFMETLHKKFGKDKKAASMAGLKGAGARMTWKKARSSKDWDGFVKASLELLKLNPWDRDVLLGMATVCEMSKSDECQLYFLKAALDTNPKDPEVNRIAALALTRIGQFEQAIVCWHRVEQALPNDPQAPKEIADLTVKRQMPRERAAALRAQATGMPNPKPAERRTDEPQASEATSEIDEAAEARFRRKIAERPEDLGNYLELSELLLHEERWDEAEELVRKTIEIAGPGDLKLRERLEDYQIRRRQRQYEIAAARAKKSGDEEALALAKRLKAEWSRFELEIFAARCERSPGNDVLQFELGLRLKKAGKFSEAIQSLQLARGNVKRKAQVHVELGECFQYIKQYKLAMSNYEQAIEASSDRDPDIRKLALYRAGVLAMGLREWNLADRRLTELAGVDFGYKDVAERLDKLSQLRNSK